MKQRFLLSLLSAVILLLPAAQEAAESQPAATNAPPKPAAPVGNWQNLFATEEWYKSHTEKEQMYEGKLEAVPNAGGPSTFMRSSYYRLGKRNIYTGGRKNAVLDKLVGSQVRIQGKPYDIELEGRQVSEIWPAAVRALK